MTLIVEAFAGSLIIGFFITSAAVALCRSSARVSRMEDMTKIEGDLAGYVRDLNAGMAE